MSFSFKYRKELFKNKVRYFPKISVMMYNLGVSLETVALLDSGASDIFVPKEIADALGLPLGKQDTADAYGGKFKIWESKVGIIVGRGSQTFRKIMNCSIPDVKSENQEVVFGRTFFEFFEITFKETEKKTILKRVTKKMDYSKKFRR